MMGMGHRLLPRSSGSPFSKTSKSPEGSSRIFTKDKAEAKDAGYSLGTHSLLYESRLRIRAGWDPLKRWLAT